MKIYLAARYGRREEMANYAARIMSDGHEITARWILGIHGADDGNQTRWGEFAQDDWDDIRRSEVLILFGEHEAVQRNSRLVELGMAIERGLKVIVIGGVKESIFHDLPDVLRFPEWSDFYREWLQVSMETP